VNFGTTGAINFSTTRSSQTFSLQSADSTVRSYHVNEIILAIPNLSNGSWNVSVMVNGVQSNAVSFEVTGQSGVTDPYAYPNPFNPYLGEISNIVINPQGATTATVYIFDMTAKLVQKIVWPQTGISGNRVTWDGINAYGEIVGDGAYLYRVVDGNKLLGKGKILVINRK
jgi:flagellar hook assembly protein FlgD